MTAEPLRDRLPTYGRWFAVEVGAAAVVSMVVWWIADVTWLQAFSGSLIGLGVLSLLAGGASGGGYVTAGTFGVNYGRRHDQGWNSTEAEIGRAQDLRGRLRSRLRPEANPTAFWQVMGGLALIGLGILAVGAA
jgi:hypothetical protein